LEKYGLTGWVTRTSRPSIDRTAVESSFITESAYAQHWRQALLYLNT
jgi:hypothetical protein